MFERMLIPFRALMIAVAVAAFLAAGSCGRDVRLAERNVRKGLTVREVTHYGVQLDRQASPVQVSYVLLRAIRDNVRARTAREREAALDVQFDLAAANVIRARNPLPISGDEFLFNVVYRWAPTVSHYVHNFDLDREAAAQRFRLHGPVPLEGSDAEAMEAAVTMQLDDPSGDPNAGVVMVVSLVQDEGFWRVVRLGFDPSRRMLAGLGGPAAPE